MESQKSATEGVDPRQSAVTPSPSALREVILHQLDLVPDREQEKVLEFINTLIDADLRTKEFNRLQGKLHCCV